MLERQREKSVILGTILSSRAIKTGERIRHRILSSHRPWGSGKTHLKKTLQFRMHQYANAASKRIIMVFRLSAKTRRAILHQEILTQLFSTLLARLNIVLISNSKISQEIMESSVSNDSKNNLLRKKSNWRTQKETFGVGALVSLLSMIVIAHFQR